MSTTDAMFETLESHCDEIAVEPGQHVPGEPLVWDIWPGDGIGGTTGFWEAWSTEELTALHARGNVTIHDRRTRTLWCPPETA